MPNRSAHRYSLIGLALLVAFHVANNGLWRATNVVVLGFDRMFHQVTSLAYYEILRQGLSLRTLFEALTWSDYYPPLVHLTAAGAYGLFGVSMDVAAMANSLYLAILLLAVYGIGERLAGPWIGLLSAWIVSLFPMIFAMSRYLYIDFALTAMVAANVCLLLRSERFARRGYAIGYGLSLGLGLLVKWTFVVFAAGPLLAVLLRRETAAGLWQAVRAILGDWRRWGLAALLGLAVTAVWFLPNREATARLPLGLALVPASWGMWTVTWRFLLAPPGTGSNLAAALGLGACVASGWYLTKVNFFSAFWLNAYGKATGRSWGFLPYLDMIVREELSPLFALLILLAVAALVLRRWRRAGSWRAALAPGLDGWALVLWAGLSYAVFSAQVSIIHSRYVMPLLPPLGIALALALGRIPGRRLRSAAIGAFSAVALIQFAALSFDALAGWQQAVPAFARGYSIQQPASGPTDPGYWVAPDVLRVVDEQRDADPARLGILVNTQQVNSKHFIYLVYTDAPHVHIEELAELGTGRGIYGRLFESDFLLLIDPPPHYARRPEARETLERLIATQDDTFHRAFALIKTYPLPDGTRLLLYGRRFARPPEDDLAAAGELMADLAARAQPGDAVLVSPPELVYALGRHADGSVPLYPVSAGTISASGAPAAGPAGLPGRLWAVLGEAPAGSEAAQLSGRLSGWMAGHLYPAGQAWHGPLQLLLYAPAPAAGEGGPWRDAARAWQPGIELVRYRFVDAQVPLGQIARLDLVWQAREPVPEPYKVFVHLLDGQGNLAGQHDGEPGAGAQPTGSWAPGRPVDDRHGLLLPADLAPGEYQIALGWYHAASGERLTACCPEADAVVLARLWVEGGTAHLEPAR